MFLLRRRDPERIEVEVDERALITNEPRPSVEYNHKLDLNEELVLSDGESGGFIVNEYGVELGIFSVEEGLDEFRKLYETRGRVTLYDVLKEGLNRDNIPWRIRLTLNWRQEV